MPRQPRLDTPGPLHHVMGRGIDGIRNKDVVKRRKILCQIAVKRMGYSGADVARFPGITVSGVNRLAASYVIWDTEKYH